MTLTWEEKKQTKEGLKLLKKGIKTPAFSSVFIVPVSKYETEKSIAEMKDGILTIKVSAKDEIKPKKITIN